MPFARASPPAIHSSITHSARQLLCVRATSSPTQTSGRRERFLCGCLYGARLPLPARLAWWVAREYADGCTRKGGRRSECTTQRKKRAFALPLCAATYPLVLSEIARRRRRIIIKVIIICLSMRTTQSSVEGMEERPTVSGELAAYSQTLRERRSLASGAKGPARVRAPGPRDREWGAYA